MRFGNVPRPIEGRLNAQDGVHVLSLLRHTICSEFHTSEQLVGDGEILKVRVIARGEEDDVLEERIQHDNALDGEIESREEVAGATLCRFLDELMEEDIVLSKMGIRDLGKRVVLVVLRKQLTENDGLDHERRQGKGDEDGRIE